MNEEKRIDGGYEIIESCTIGSNELVIGHNPKAPNPYVCWYCKNGNKKTQDRAYGADPLCGLLRKAILRTEVV